MNEEGYKIKINTPDSGYEPFPVSIMNRSTREVMTFDPSLGEPAKISYKLNKHGCIRIRLVHRNERNLLIRTLQDWTKQDFGEYELYWDGRDASGNIVDNKNILVLFEAKDQGKGLKHLEHDEVLCRDLLLKIKNNPEPSQIVKGTFKILTSLQGNAFGFLGKNDGEIRYFINYKLFRTEKFQPGVRGFECMIDTTILKNGEHLIIINVDDLHDHVGSASIKIKVKN